MIDTIKHRRTGWIPQLAFVTALAAAAALAPAQANAATDDGIVQPMKTGSSCLDGLRDDTGRSSVDGREIRFTNSTKYDDAQSHAHAGWTSSGLSQIKLKGDAWNTSNDLDWKEKNKKDGALATWTRHGGSGATDTIEMNDYYLHQGRPGTWDTPFYRRAAAAHELGHALGLCHKSAAYGSSIMVKSAGDIPSIKPTSRDRGDYHKLWG
ncbi:hypothetical protein [Streptomyces sp. NPDC049813]|uniref:hypothetical protein n=1 Tax=Streptomyces sp. NPDC049813 TaxID=3365597 RepID=UPI0037BA800D